MGQFIKAAKKSEIEPNQGKLVMVGDKRIALFNVSGEFHAIDDTCTHSGGPLSEGMIESDQVTCPWHGAVFNVKTGAVCRPPAPESVARYNVRINGEDIEIEV